MKELVRKQKQPKEQELKSKITKHDFYEDVKEGFEPVTEYNEEHLEVV